MRNKSLLKAVQCLAIALLLLLLCSCISFDISDWPSSFVYPHNRPAANLCGSIGAFCAYYLMYYIGPGVFVLLISSIYFLAAALLGRPITQPVLRAVGLVLLTVAASSSFYCFWPHRVYDFPMGSGGLLGAAAVHFLRSHFALLGTGILITSTWIVGLVLLADRFILEVLVSAKRAVAGLGAFGFVLAKTARFFGRIYRINKNFFIYLFYPVILSKKALLILSKKAAKRRQRAEDNRRRSIALATERGQRTEVRHPTSDFGPQTSDLRPPTSDLRPPTSDLRLPSVASAKEGPPTSDFRCRSYEDYILPPLDLLAEPQYSFTAVQEKVVKAKAAALEKLLGEFSINARVVTADTGPVVTMFELELAAGVKVSQVSSLSNDMARALGAGAVRVVAPLPGKHTIGIEVPNTEKEKVRIKDLMQLAGSRPERMQIPLFLGKDSSGQALVSDLTTMPHLLIAGTTGSGKSVCINGIITGILLTKRPDEVKMILIDPKMVEMTAFNTIPHLMCPIVTETQRAVQILEWATVKMDERYSLLSEARVKNVIEYNRLGPEEIVQRFKPSTADEEAMIPKTLTYIVIVIDELADLMMTAAKEIEAYIVRLAQKSRAVGIHIILATQRPQATVVTGLIKSNMPTRVGFRVAAKMDSRIILDQNGAETLLGQGDMLFLKPGTSDLVRAQGTFVDEAEIKRIVKHLKEIAEPQFHPELTQLRTVDVSQMRRDELFDDAVRIVLETRRGSVSLLQRRLNIGYARASRIIEMMAAAGVLGEYKGSQAREVMMTPEEYERIRKQLAADTADDARETRDDEPGPAEGQRSYVSIEDD